MDISQYSLDRHKHIFACWCAATAASQVKTFRFSVETGRNLLELATNRRQKSESQEFLDHINSIRTFKSSVQFDMWHNASVRNMLDNEHLQRVLDFENAKKSKTKTQSRLIPSEFTYGIAAKLLNCYLKAFFIESLETEFGKLIHPPIDRLLFLGLVSDETSKPYFNFSQFLHPRHISGSPQVPAWTSLDEAAYVAILSRIKSYLSDMGIQSLWVTEFAWKGHQ